MGEAASTFTVANVLTALGSVYNVLVGLFSNVITTITGNPLLYVPVLIAFYARNYFIYDLLRILGSGVIARHDDKIGVIGGYRSHDGALCSVTVAAAAKEDDKSPLFAGSQCLECVFESIRRVGIVNDYGVVSVRWDDLHSALYALCTAHSIGAVVKAYAERKADGDNAQGVVNGEFTGDG